MNPVVTTNIQNKITLTLNIVILLYVFLLPFSKAFVLSSAPWIILSLWSIEGNLKEKSKRLLTPPALFASLFFLLTSLSLLWSPELSSGLQAWKWTFSFYIAFIAIYTSLQKQFVKPLLYAFLSSIFINEILCLGIYFEWWHFENRYPSYPSPPKIDHIRYSIFLAVTIILLVWQLLSNKTPKWLKFFETFLLLSALTNLFLNTGRTGQVALFFGLLTFSMLFLRKYKKALLTLLIAIFSIPLLAYYTSPNFQSRVKQTFHAITQMQERQNFSSSLGARVATYMIVIQAIKEHPLQGYGLGGFKKAMEETIASYPKYLEKFAPYGRNISSAHNDYFQIAVQSGLPTLLLFLLFFISSAKHAPSNPLLRATFLAILVTLFIAGLPSYLLKNNSVGLLAFVFGLFLNPQSKVLES